MSAAVKSVASSKRRSSVTSEEQDSIRWTFLTNHAHVLLYLYRNHDQRLRDIALAVGITERMVQRIIGELVDAGYLKISKVGRLNRYVVNLKLRLRHRLESHHSIRDLIDALK